MTPESPKSRFLKSTAASEHVKMAESAIFQASLDVALLQMQWAYGTSTGIAEASATQLRMEGAQSFARTLMTLSDKSQPQTPIKGDSLPNPQI